MSNGQVAVKVPGGTLLIPRAAAVALRAAEREYVVEALAANDTGASDEAHWTTAARAAAALPPAPDLDSTPSDL